MEGKWNSNYGADKPTDKMKVAGIGVLTLGLLLAGWVIHTIYRLVTSGSAPALVSSIVPIDAVDTTIRLSSEIITFPDSFLFVFGILILVFLLGICAGISKTLITTGAHLLQKDYSDTLKRIERELIDQKKNSSPDKSL